MEERLDATFAALADPTRRSIVARLATGDATVNELAAPFAMSLPAVCKHLAASRRAGSSRAPARPSSGLATLIGTPFDSAPGWIEESRRIWQQRFDDYDRHLRHLRRIRPRSRRWLTFPSPRIFVPRDASCSRWVVEPEHLAQFWGPNGPHTRISKITVEPHPGGVFETVMVNDADGHEYPTRAVYVEVIEPERLVWDETQSGMHVTVLFSELGPDRTEVHIHQTNAPEALAQRRAQAGFLTSLARLAAHLDTLRT